MSVLQLVIILALVGYAVYQQTRRHVLNPKMRFKMAIIYLGVGLIVGFTLPHSGAQLAFFAGSIALSIVVGWIRGSLTRVWTDGAKWYSQGTVLTVSIFLAMIVVKFGLGTLAYFMHVTETSGIGEVLVMIGAMMALQAEIVHRRALRMQSTGAGASTLRQPARV
jgi:hypothetical protein